MKQVNVKVGDVLILRADEVLGAMAEPVEVLSVEHGVALVKQLTETNGEPGTFEVYVDELEAI
jgi:hypothetical protein